jgi:GNAT superfamily N-acetyltransferase
VPGAATAGAALDRINFRQASIEDLPLIVGMLADDILGRQRELSEDPLPKSYIQAFREIDADPSNELIVAELDGDVIGTMQLTLTPSISFRGGKRCTVESVRVDEKHRGKGIGREMMLWAIDRAREKGCVSMQLTTHKDRVGAHRFYESLGFSKSHIGMKLKL